MESYVALLRGINVGPKKRIRMEPLRALVSDLGFADVRTLVNSGNVVFRGAGEPEEIGRQIEAALKEHHALDVPVVMRTGAELQQVVANNPFPDVAVTPKLLHVSFLATALPSEAFEVLEKLDTGDDRLVVRAREIYLHVPHGLSGASPAIQTSDRLVPVVATSRNWNTVTRLAEMAAS
jgi:uncharacterized protein (DUF1697 family)